MFKKVGNSLIAITIIVLTLTLGRGGYRSLTAYANTCRTAAECRELERDLRSELEDINDQDAYLEAELNEVNADIDGIIAEIERSEAQIVELEGQISSLQTSIDENVALLEIIEEDILDLEEEVANRMRAAQRMSASNTALEFLGESESLIDFVRRVRVITHLMSSDEEVMNELNDLLVLQENTLLTLHEEQIQLRTAQETLEAENEVLAIAHADLEEQQVAITGERTELAQLRISQEEAIAIAESSRRALENSNVQSVTITDGGSGFILPLSSGRVACEWMCYPGHNGIDVFTPGNTNAPILAAASGTVTVSEFNNGGYGNFIIIEHVINGQRFATLYAHMSSRAVGVGAQVTAGQVIGNKGTTGRVWGSGHLHFEIHPGGFSWGGAVNPRNHISFPAAW